MNGRIVLLTLVCLISLGLLVEFASYAQSDEAAILSKEVQDHVRAIEKWETKAWVLVFLTIVVGILGVVTGFLQRSSKKWCRTATVIAGALISCITLVNNAVFEVDHRTYLTRAQQARARPRN